MWLKFVKLWISQLNCYTAKWIPSNRFGRQRSFIQNVLNSLKVLSQYHAKHKCVKIAKEKQKKKIGNKIWWNEAVFIHILTTQAKRKTTK